MGNTEDETRIIAQAAAGDPEAFDILYRQYVTRIYRYMVTRVHRLADADDLTSQTFIAALIDISRYRGQAPFAAWLFGIASHIAANYHRANKPRVSLDDVEHLPHPTPPLDAQVHQRLQLQRVLTALCQLTPERAEAIRLRIFGELSAAEVAQVMGRSTPAAKMLIHRGIQDLRHAIGRDENEEMD